MVCSGLCCFASMRVMCCVGDGVSGFVWGWLGCALRGKFAVVWGLLRAVWVVV